MTGGNDHYDVVILGGGLAGLSLARHLLLETDRTVLLLERRDKLPPRRQKVGESLVQLAGFYFSKVLDLEEYLLREHYMKYNLRFYWKSGRRDNNRFEDFSQAYIRPFSNIASYQLDRNKLEGELLVRNLASSRFTFEPGISELDVGLREDAPHRVAFKTGGQARQVTAGWVVDTTGRNRFLARRMDLARQNAIRHGAFFWWVDGLVDIQKLTDSTPREIRQARYRRSTGHLPTWLATNHFMGEGLWFWVIPLQGKTSLGLVYDREVVAQEDVFSVEKATQWVCREFPLFARDLPHRKVLDFGGFKNFSHDCAQTISPQRWGMAGEAGRFSDPLYSPGSDLIAVYNTLLVDAIQTGDGEGDGDGDSLEDKCQLYEQLMRSVYSAYVPTYSTSYDALGDPESFSLKYTWELTIYFAGYVFPFINDLITRKRFTISFLRLFSRLGPVNDGVQRLLSGYFQWKKEHRRPQEEPVYFDFTELATLDLAEKTFYCVGASPDEARAVLAEQVSNAHELARLIAAHVASVVLDEPRVVTHRRYIEGIDLERLRFDPEDMRRRWALCCHDEALYRWRTLDPGVLDRFRSSPRLAAPAMAANAGG